MKKWFLIVLAASLLLVSCGEAETTVSRPSAESSEEAAVSTEPDTEPPTLRITKNNREVTIKKGAEFDLKQGVSATDNVDGKITDKIEINKNGFDPNVPGEYTVGYFVTDAAGNSAEPVFRKITVVETDAMAAPPLWEQVIEGEKKNPAKPALFGGAWYYKVVSSKDKWVGIEATVTLPEVDINRYNGTHDDSYAADPGVKNLDNPSVYLGGHAQTESDVGLSFSRALVDVKSSTLSTGCIAFRPFWRYITDKDQDVGGYDAHGGEYAVSANGNNCIANYHWKYTEYYYLPGDQLRIIVFSPEPGKMQLQIEVLAVSTLPSSVEIREKYGWNDPADFLSPIFTSPGQGTGMDAEFKRVCAIDQSGNEGGTAIDTTTLVKDVIWHETYLYRVIDGTLYRVPMSEDRRASIGAPYADRYTVTHEGVDSSKGGEVVTIHPGYKE